MRTCDLAPVLLAWLDEYRQERPSTRDRREWTGQQYMGAMAHLAHHTELSQRRLYSIINQQVPVVGLRLADRILVAISENGKLGKEIPVIPNPNWKDRWIETYMVACGVEVHHWREHLVMRGVVLQRPQIMALSQLAIDLPIGTEFEIISVAQDQTTVKASNDYGEQLWDLPVSGGREKRAA